MQCRHCQRMKVTYARRLCSSCYSNLTIRELYPREVYQKEVDSHCRNCQQELKGKWRRPKNLCWTCYYAPGVRERFPSTNKFARRGNSLHVDRRLPLPEPTSHPPGSPEKVAVLEQRARNRQQLFHPADAVMDPESHRLGVA